jgi:hypothetical protein
MPRLPIMQCKKNEKQSQKHTATTKNAIVRSFGLIVFSSPVLITSHFCVIFSSVMATSSLVLSTNGCVDGFLARLVFPSIFFLFGSAYPHHKATQDENQGKNRHLQTTPDRNI